MPGEGFIQQMISSIRNNKTLRSKSKFKDYGNEILKDYKTKLSFKKVSEEELEKIKRIIRIEARRKFLINRVIAVIVILGAVFIFFAIGYNEYVKEKKYKEYLIEEKKKDKFNSLMYSGYVFLNEEKLDISLKQYKRAKELYPNDSLINSRIKLVDSLINVSSQ